MNQSIAPTANKPRTGKRVTLDEALTFLRAHRNQLESMGGLHAGIFGSVARGEDGPNSDLDVFVVIDESKRWGVYGFVGIIHYLQDNLSERVDVVERDAMKPRIRESASAHAVEAF